MKQQVIVIHGGDSFHTYEAFLQQLHAQEIDLSRVGFKDWKSTLGETLGEPYEVIAPRMPNAQNAKYTEWKIWFEKFIPFLQNGIIFIGHSLGGIFLAKYLAEEKLPVSVSATFLVAAPYNTEMENILGDFVLPNGLLDLFTQQGGKIFLYHSEDDMVVPFPDSKKYQDVLPNAVLRVFKDRQHFNQAELPELLEDIRDLAA